MVKRSPIESGTLFLSVIATLGVLFLGYQLVRYARWTLELQQRISTLEADVQRLGDRRR